MKIVIVEDNEDNRRLAMKRLRAAGHTVLEAPAGADLPSRLRDDPPDLVLLDLQLPEIDGLSLARALRADPALSATAVVACTAFAMPGDRERALGAGCDGYVSKPVDIRQLPQQLLEIYHATRR
jgi:two-component system cell cycle response regulator DivK